MKKSIILLLFIATFVVGIQAQSSQLGFYGGFAKASQKGMTPGLDLGFEFKKYLNDNLYFTALFHFDETRGSANNVKHPQADVSLYNVSYSSNYTSLAAGAGYRIPFSERHSVYAQAALGLSDINREISYNIPSDVDLLKKYPSSKHPFYRTNLGVSGFLSAGYDFKILSWAALGAQYTLMVPDRYINQGFSFKLSFLFD